MSGHPYTNGQGMHPPGPDPAMNMHTDAVYEAHRLFAAYPPASATPSAHGAVVCLSLHGALTRDGQ